MGTPAEVLRDEEESWGKSRVEYGLIAQREAERQRRVRRSRYLAAVTRPMPRDERGRYRAPAIELDGEVFVGPSGIKAIRAYVVTHETSAVERGDDARLTRREVSLPFVSIQHNGGQGYAGLSQPSRGGDQGRRGGPHPRAEA